MNHVYYGSGYSNEGIEPLLQEAKVEFEKPDDLTEYVADELANESLVGWFQGRMELGPRALGNRSILADPRTEASRDRINEYVKHREAWRPFAPSMTREAAKTYLENDRDSPFMIDTFETLEDGRDDIAAVLHPADATTRPHIVTADRNRRYYDLIESFADRTDVPVVLNTSFNDHGEPIVRTPKEPLRSFYSMGLDILVLNNCVVKKR
jgi:carbamoyltransferase